MMGSVRASARSMALRRAFSPRVGASRPVACVYAAFTAGGTLHSVVGVVSAFRSNYSVEPRSPMDLTP